MGLVDRHHVLGIELQLRTETTTGRLADDLRRAKHGSVDANSVSPRRDLSEIVGTKIVRPPTLNYSLPRQQFDASSRERKPLRVLECASQNLSSSSLKLSGRGTVASPRKQP
jgi:hypothetical protein